MYYNYVNYNHSFEYALITHYEYQIYNNINPDPEYLSIIYYTRNELRFKTKGNLKYLK